MELAALLSIRAQVSVVSEAQLRGADEIWLAFATRGVLPVTTLDGLPVGSGKPGPLFERMYLAFLNYTKELAGTAAL
jgi:D-alanine transaminase